VTSETWIPHSQANHQQFIERAKAKGRFQTEDEIVNFLALALCGEAGELANILKKQWRGDSLDRTALIAELADIRIYLEHLASHLGVDLDEACRQKVEVVRKRLAASEAA